MTNTSWVFPLHGDLHSLARNVAKAVRASIFSVEQVMRFIVRAKSRQTIERLGKAEIQAARISRGRK